MKLLTKTALYVATLSLFLFFLMGIAFYQILRNISINELEREIQDIRTSVEDNFPFILQQRISELPGIDSLGIRPVGLVETAVIEFRDTVLYDTKSDQYRNFTIHSFTILDGEEEYLLELFKSTTPTDKLVERITILLTLMLILFLAGIYLLNRYIFNSLWKDFFVSLDKLKSYSADKGPLFFKESDIQEFIELNQVLVNITSRLSADYKQLKEYTDNTTHELQTPLANIKSRVELLLQSDMLEKDELEMIRDIYRNADHLSRLNSTLNLITRIENQQYQEKHKVNITELVIKQLEMLQELAALRNIKIHKEVSSQDIKVTMDQGLADILIVNLLKNAINHNINEGFISIKSSAHTLIISNSGNPPLVNSEKLFERFFRETRGSDNLGLGLALVKKICDYYDFSIEHTFDNDKHIFSLKFNQDN